MKGNLYRKYYPQLYNSEFRGDHLSNTVVRITNEGIGRNKHGELNMVWYKDLSKDRYGRGAATWFYHWFKPMTPIEIAQYRIKKSQNLV